MPSSPQGLTAETCYSPGSLARALKCSSTFRAVLPGPWWECISMNPSPVLASPHWIPVSYRIDIKCLWLAFKCVHHNTPKYLKEVLRLFAPTRSLSPAITLQSHVPRNQTPLYGGIGLSALSSHTFVMYFRTTWRPPVSCPSLKSG